MRKFIAKVLFKLGQWVDPRPMVVEEAIEPPTTLEDGYADLRDRIRDVNELMHFMPGDCYPWIDWSVRPRRVVICQYRDKKIVFNGE